MGQKNANKAKQQRTKAEPGVRLTSSMSSKALVSWSFVSPMPMTPSTFVQPSRLASVISPKVTVVDTPPMLSTSTERTPAGRKRGRRGGGECALFETYDCWREANRRTPIESSKTCCLASWGHSRDATARRHYIHVEYRKRGMKTLYSILLSVYWCSCFHFLFGALLSPFAGLQKKKESGCMSQCTR